MDRPPVPVPPRRPPADAWVHICDRCGERMDERQCKIVCPRCAFCRDCSDP